MGIVLTPQTKLKNRVNQFFRLTSLKNGKPAANFKERLLVLFVLLRFSVWTLGGSRWTDVTSTYVARWHEIRCGRHIVSAKFLKSSVEFSPFWTYIHKPKDK